MLAYAAFTTAGLLGDPFPAGAGLLALSLGDGLGGLAGRQGGRAGYSPPWGRRKTWLGSAVVAAMAALAVAIAAAWFGRSPGPGPVAAGALAAALAEGLSPPSADNLTVPLATWAVLAFS